MEVFKKKSLDLNIKDEDVDKGVYSVSFLSFERAIRESEELNRTKRTVKGYIITEQGISIILED